MWPLLMLSLILATDNSEGAFVGRWRNADKQTRGVTTVEIQVRGNIPYVHMWGKCSPKDCDMGEVAAEAYGKSPSDAPDPEVLVIRGDERLSILRLSAGRLNVEVFTKFPPGDQRTNYRAVFEFDKSPVPIRGGGW